jgi:hypothetical protein
MSTLLSPRAVLRPPYDPAPGALAAMLSAAHPEHDPATARVIAERHPAIVARHLGADATARAFENAPPTLHLGERARLVRDGWRFTPILYRLPSDGAHLADVLLHLREHGYEAEARSVPGDATRFFVIARPLAVDLASLCGPTGIGAGDATCDTEDAS